MEPLVDKVNRASLIPQSAFRLCQEAAPLLAALEAIRIDGGTAVVKLDGERSQDPYTVIVSGGSLGSDFYRRDGSDLIELLDGAIRFYNDRVWHLE